jgi:hypothetical protein
MKHLNRRFGKQPRKFNYTIVFRSATIQQVLRASHRASKCTVLPCSLHARRPRSPPLLISPGAGRTCVSVRCLVRTNHLQARDEGTRPMLSLPLLLHRRRSLRSPQPHVTAPHSPVPRTREVGCARTHVLARTVFFHVRTHLCICSLSPDPPHSTPTLTD